MILQSETGRNCPKSRKKNPKIYQMYQSQMHRSTPCTFGCSVAQLVSASDCYLRRRSHQEAVSSSLTGAVYFVDFHAVGPGPQIILFLFFGFMIERVVIGHRF